MQKIRDDIIYQSIPQRPPFLFVDRVLSIDENKIVTALNLTGEEDFFKGHFPGNPVFPGVLMQETLFQTAAILASQMALAETAKLGVVSRVQNAKFKNMVKPPAALVCEVTKGEALANAYFMTGKLTLEGKIVLVMEFSVALV